MKKKILVVDDDPQIRKSLRKVLRAEGYEVALAADGEEGIGRFNVERIELLVLDLNLPGNSGWDIFGTLSSLNPFLPIINPITTPRLAAARRWVGELSYQLATNRYVFYGSLILVASLIADAVTRGHETLWRSAAALGIAAVVIGLFHAWLDARSARRSRCGGL